MYQAKLHPEQYSNTFSDGQIKRLHDAIIYVCKTSVEANADSDKFPEHWLMKHRWGKGKKDGNKLPNGEKIVFLKVGGRTSAVVPSVQKKTGVVAGDVSDDANDVEGLNDDVPSKEGRKRKHKTSKNEDGEDEDEEVGSLAKPKRVRKKVKEDEVEEEELEEVVPAKRQSTTAKDKNTSESTPRKGKAGAVAKSEDVSGRRRSGRLSKT
jgi:hypothetical protein